jgi:hypothetical protein
MMKSMLFALGMKLSLAWENFKISWKEAIG